MPVLPRVGDRFGRYRIDSEIGRGGMGVVFGATDTTIDRVVALKVVSSSLGESDEFRQRFEREAAVLARINSPHIIAIFDYGRENDCPYIATQYVAGGDLGGLIAARGPMPPTLAAMVCGQVADALHDAHRVGVVHRDVKPTNVLLRDADVSDLHAYLCDFGIARTASEGLTTPGSVAGTWSYLAPECGRGEAGTPASDVYALGCLFWAALTGTAPYRGTDVEIAVAHQRAPIPQLGGEDPFSRQASAILARSMAKAPRERYADADQMRLDLAQAATLPAGGPLQPIYPPAPVASTAAGTARRQDRLSLTGGSGVGSGAGSGFDPATGAPAYGPRAGSKRRTGLVVGAAALAVVLIAGGAFGITRLVAGGEDTPAATGTGTGAGIASGADGEPITADFDGDGLGDVKINAAYRDPAGSPDNVQFADTVSFTSDGSAFVDQQSEQIDDSSDVAVFRVPGLFDDDTTTDLLDVVFDIADGAPITASLSGTTSDGTAYDQPLEGPEGRPAVPISGDLDGDGTDEIIFQRVLDDSEPVILDYVDLADGEAGPIEELVEVPGSTLDATRISFGDYDGDGADDLAALTRGAQIGDTSRNRHALVVYYTRDGAVSEESTTRNIKGRFLGNMAADIDGDGDDEIVLPQPGFDSFKMRVVETDGEELSTPQARGLVSPGENGPVGPEFDVTDANGDGLDDIVTVVSTGANEATLFLFRSSGERFGASPWGTYAGPFPASISATMVGEPL